MAGWKRKASDLDNSCWGLTWHWTQHPRWWYRSCQMSRKNPKRPKLVQLYIHLHGIFCYFMNAPCNFLCHSVMSLAVYSICVWNVTLYSFLHTYYLRSFSTEFVLSNINGSVWSHCRPIVSCWMCILCFALWCVVFYIMFYIMFYTMLVNIPATTFRLTHFSLLFHFHGLYWMQTAKNKNWERPGNKAREDLCTCRANDWDIYLIELLHLLGYMHETFNSEVQALQ